jgi:hypothetical protein
MEFLPHGTDFERSRSTNKFDWGDKDDEALKAYREGLAIAERLAAADCSNADRQRDLAASYDDIARRLVDSPHKPSVPTSADTPGSPPGRKADQIISHLSPAENHKQCRRKKTRRQRGLPSELSLWSSSADQRRSRGFANLSRPAPHIRQVFEANVGVYARLMSELR